MASRKLTRRLSRRGYECEFVHPPPSYLQTECSVCLLVLRSPHITSCCGHNFCKTCIGDIRTGGKACPLCNKDEFALVYNRTHDATLKQLDAYCPNRKTGCKWIGKLEALDEHLNRDPEFAKPLVGCAFEELQCYHDGCGQFIQRQSIIEHQTERCSKRPFVCQYCHDYSSSHDDVVNHWAVCICYPVSCPHKCSQKTFERKSLQKHLDEECPLHEVECSFKYAGCKTKLPRRDMAAHVKENVTHMSLLALQNQKLLTKLAKKDEQLAEMADENRKTIEERVESLMQDQRQKLEQTCAQISNKYQKDLEKLEQEKNQQIERLTTEVDQMRQRMKEIRESLDSLKATVSTDLEGWVRALTQNSQTDSSQLERRITQAESSLLKLCHHTQIAPIQITMPKFDQHRKEGRTWYSSGFYTHPHGYKVCLSVVANGTAAARGTHVSCIIYLMRGEFDNHLTWPFRGDFTIQLLNQRDRSNHHEISFSFDDDTVDTAAARVTNEERAPIGWGYPRFIRHNGLGYSSAKNCQYLMNNCLYFRVVFQQQH